MCHVTLWRGPLTQSHHPAQFGGCRPCESGDMICFICRVTTISKCHVTLSSVSVGWVSLSKVTNLLSLGISRPYGSGDNGLFNIGCNYSNSSSNAEVYKLP